MKINVTVIYIKYYHNANKRHHTVQKQSENKWIYDVHQMTLYLK